MIRKVPGGFLFKCDRCGEWHYVPDVTVEEDAVKQAEKEGWKLGKRHLCDICRRNNERYNN